METNTTGAAEFITENTQFKFSKSRVKNII